MLYVSVAATYLDTLLTSTGIIQDDEDDWKESAATMAGVYENSFVTIAATWSANSDDGLFSKMESFRNGRQLKSSSLRVCGREMPSHFDMPLLKRAWVFQERRLSSRVIHFLQGQTMWECGSCRRSEDGCLDHDRLHDSYNSREIRLLDDSGKGLFKYVDEDVDDAWRCVVSNYSGLELTFDKDRLPAISAMVARAMRVRKNDKYIAGMWEKSLLRDMAWYKQIHTEGTKRLPTLAPTWSWASVGGAVLFHDVSVLPIVEQLGVRFTCIGPAHVGETKDAKVVLRGPFLTASLMKSDWKKEDRRFMNKPTYEIKPYISPEYRHLKPIIWGFEPDFDLSTGETPIDPETRYPILVLWRNQREHRWFGLVLRRVSGNGFERLGIFHLSYFDPPGSKKGCSDMIKSLPVGNITTI